MKGHKNKGAAVGTSSGIVVGDGKRRVLHLGPHARLVAIGVMLLLVLAGVGTVVYVQRRHHQEAQQAKNDIAVNMQKPLHPGQIVVTQDEINQAQQVIAVTGTVQSFDGTTIKFKTDGSTSPLNLRVTSSTKYSKGVYYAPAKASGLKARSRAVIAYNQKTNEALNVSYGL